MLGFEHPSHMVTHPSTDEAQCCLSLEILVNSSKKEEEEESRIKSPLRIEGTKNCAILVTYYIGSQECNILQLTLTMLSLSL